MIEYYCSCNQCKRLRYALERLDYQLIQPLMAPVREACLDSLRHERLMAEEHPKFIVAPRSHFERVVEGILERDGCIFSLR